MSKKYLPHEQRVITEHDELKVKHSALTVFMDGDIFAALPSEDQYLLRAQHGHMSEYLSVLSLRIQRFTPA